VTQHSKPVRLAAAAFQAALAGKSDAAIHYVQRINDECGGHGIYVALMAWIDSYADHATGGLPGRAKVRMSYIQEDTGELTDDTSEKLPHEIAWAGQLTAARVALDQDRFDELIRRMPKDGGQIGLYVVAVLECVTRTINGLPRGFARMGEAS
jgi:hypothetical protein